MSQITVEFYTLNHPLFTDADLYDPGRVCVLRNPVTGRGVEVSVDGDLCVDIEGRDRSIRTHDDVAAWYAEVGKPLDASANLEVDLIDIYGADSDIVEWIYNRWFDLYDADTGEHLDGVCYELREAIEDAGQRAAEMPPLPSGGWCVVSLADLSIAQRHAERDEALAQMKELGDGYAVTWREP